MGFNKEQKDERTEHEWEKKWHQNDYRAHTEDLIRLKDEYDKCVADWATSDKKGSNRHPDFIFQFRNNGVTADGSVRYSKYESFQQYDINIWKLKKLENWRALNMTPEEELTSLEKSKAIIAQIDRMF